MSWRRVRPISASTLKTASKSPICSSRRRSGRSRAIEGTLLPVAATKTTSGFEVDLREIVPALDGLALDGLAAPSSNAFAWRAAAIASGGRCSSTKARRSTTGGGAARDGAVVRARRLPLPARDLGRPQQRSRGHAGGGPVPSQGTAHPSQPLRVPVEFERRKPSPVTAASISACPAAGCRSTRWN